MVENVISVMEPALSIGSASVIDGFIRPKSMQQVYIRAYIGGQERIGQPWKHNTAD